jgi:hypothetical protein
VFQHQLSGQAVKRGHHLNARQLTSPACPALRMNGHAAAERLGQYELVPRLGVVFLTILSDE